MLSWCFLKRWCLLLESQMMFLWYSELEDPLLQFCHIINSHLLCTNVVIPDQPFCHMTSSCIMWSIHSNIYPHFKYVQVCTRCTRCATLTLVHTVSVTALAETSKNDSREENWKNFRSGQGKVSRASARLLRLSVRGTGNKEIFRCQPSVNRYQPSVNRYQPSVNRCSFRWKS